MPDIDSEMKPRLEGWTFDEKSLKSNELLPIFNFIHHQILDKIEEVDIKINTLDAQIERNEEMRKNLHARTENISSYRRIFEDLSEKTATQVDGTYFRPSKCVNAVSLLCGDEAYRLGTKAHKLYNENKELATQKKNLGAEKERLELKATKVTCLCNVVRSFLLKNPSERRASFVESMNALRDANKALLKFDLEQTKLKQNALAIECNREKSLDHPSSRNILSLYREMHTVEETIKTIQAKLDRIEESKPLLTHVRIDEEMRFADDLIAWSGELFYDDDVEELEVVESLLEKVTENLTDNEDIVTFFKENPELMEDLSTPLDYFEAASLPEPILENVLSAIPVDYDNCDRNTRRQTILDELWNHGGFSLKQDKLLSDAIDLAAECGDMNIVQTICNPEYEDWQLTTLADLLADLLENQLITTDEREYSATLDRLIDFRDTCEQQRLDKKQSAREEEQTKETPSNTAETMEVEQTIAELETESAEPSAQTEKVAESEQIITDFQPSFTYSYTTAEPAVAQTIDEPIDTSAEVKKEDEPVKGSIVRTINPEYYQALPSAERVMHPEPTATADKIMQDLDKWKIHYSGIELANGNTVLTVSQKDDRAFQRAEIRANTRRQFTQSQSQGTRHNTYIQREGAQKTFTASKTAQTKPNFPKIPSALINADYFKQMPREDRHITEEPSLVAERIMQELDRQNVAYSAVIRSNDTVAITVSKSDRNAFQRAEDKAIGNYLEILNPEVYKSIPYKDRAIKEMPESTARKTAARLDRLGIQYSAKLNGEKSAVTVHKKDEQTAFFTRSKMKKMATQIRSEQSNRPQQTNTKRKKQGID